MTAIHHDIDAFLHAESELETSADAGIGDRLFQAIIGSLEVQAAYLGDRLGWYRTLAANGPLTAGELAARTDTDARYAREWLEHQAVSGYVRVVDAAADPDERRFALPDVNRAALVDEHDIAYLLPFARMAATFGKSLDDVVRAYRTGAGVSWAHHGADAREAQADANRPMFMQQLAREYLASIPEVDAALLGGGRVADIGCGFGWSSIGVATGYPDARVDGFDIDGPSIERARANARAEGVARRVQFHELDVATIEHTQLTAMGPYDLVLALECIHDLSDPVGVLAAMRQMAGATGTVVVMDERVREAFTGEPDPVEQLMYGFSLVGCLPDGRTQTPSAATGTVMRPSTLECYAVAAGFTAMRVLPVEHDFFRFYVLEST